MPDFDVIAFVKLGETKSDILSKLHYLKKGGLAEYIKYALAELGLKRLPQKLDEQIIKQILAKSPNDLEKKKTNREYYIAHVSCIKTTLELMLLNDGFLSNLEKHKISPDRDPVVYNYFNLLHEILFDMALLVEDHKRLVKKEKFKPLVAKTTYQSSFTLYQLLPQVIFGQESFHAYIHREPNVAIALIRQIIELKMRHGFGVLGVYDTAKDSIEPLSLRKLFDEIKKHKSDVDFALPLDNIMRIDGWANIFMHSGRKDYTWTLIYVYWYLHEFIKGRTTADGWDANSGIRISQNVLDAIVAGLENTLKANQELYRSKPDAVII